MISMTKGFSTHKNSAPNVRFAFNTRRPRYVRKKKISILCRFSKIMRIFENF